MLFHLLYFLLIYFITHQERDVNEESGWKLVHGDVFRPPRNLVLLSSLVGIGTQLAALILLVILLAIIGMLYIGYALHLLCCFIKCIFSFQADSSKATIIMNRPELSLFIDILPPKCHMFEVINIKHYGIAFSWK